MSILWVSAISILSLRKVELIQRVGWKVILTPRVPKITSEILPPTFSEFLSTLPSLPSTYQTARDFDWAMHPGGATILTGAERVLGISPEHMRASYDTYINHGNSSSATIFGVMDRLRSKDMDQYAPGGKVKDYVVGCAFGPGITVEICMLKRNLGPTGIQTPPETESEASRSEAGDEDVNNRETVPATAGSDSISGVKDGASVAAPDTQNRAVAQYESFVSEALEAVELD